MPHRPLGRTLWKLSRRRTRFSYLLTLLGEFPSLSIHAATASENSNSNSTFIALNLCQKTDSKAHHTKTLFNIQKPETLQGSAPRKKQEEIGKFRVGMLFQRGMTSTLT